MTAEERAELREWVTASRRAQGLPDRISDPSVLARARETLRPNRTQAPELKPGPASRTASSSWNSCRAIPTDHRVVAGE